MGRKSLHANTNQSYIETNHNRKTLTNKKVTLVNCQKIDLAKPKSGVPGPGCSKPDEKAKTPATKKIYSSIHGGNSWLKKRKLPAITNIPRYITVSLTVSLKKAGTYKSRGLKH